MTKEANFKLIFDDLKQNLQELVPPLVIKEDTDDNFTLIAPPSPNRSKELFIGAVLIKKNYVSYHLMPVYMFPNLLEGLSASLKKHMQGKSCFNFTREDESLFAELKQLTLTSFEYARNQQIP
jgi:hypothetical protein